MPTAPCLRTQTSWLRTLALLACLPVGVAACGPTTGPNDFRHTDDDSSSGSNGGSGGSDPDDDFIDTNKGSGSGGGDDMDACATSSAEATLVPVTMFITVDKSGSMGDSNKWNNAKAAFLAFFADPNASSLRVALRFWPADGCDDSSCSVDACSQPKVGVGPLSDPAQVQSLTSAFNATSPGGGTPMSAALGGATKWASDYVAQTNGTERAVVILVTDGEPNGCDEDISHIAGQAATAFDAAGVQTFAVGLAGSNQATMDAIAAGGSTSQGFFIGNGNAQADLLAALQQIQKSTVACEFTMPVPENGEKVDPTKVNVSYTPGDGGKAVTLGQVTGAGACTDAQGGWYYDDPIHPKTITLCPSTCAAVQSDDGAKMEIVLGCDTQPA